mmetsp:Transcript_14127/g.32087  ORF Transcript_14127/g.32087 Transcript_14127/m.32087 type:complete len:363 (-) Transcript_14127:108-1196(-)
MVLEILVTLLTKALVVTDVAGAGSSSGEREDERKDNEVSTNHQDDNGNDVTTKRTRRIQYIPLFFLMIDVMDIALDLVFSIQLFVQNQQPIFGSVLLGTTLLSMATWWWSRHYVFQRQQQQQMSARTLRRCIVFFEMSMFFIQDATTIFIFLSVSESYQVGTLNQLNLMVTMICGLAVIVSDLCLLCNLCHCSYNNNNNNGQGNDHDSNDSNKSSWSSWVKSCCKGFWMALFNLFCFVWTLVYALALLALALVVMVSGGHVDDEDGTTSIVQNKTYFWTRFWTITSGLWIVVLLGNVAILQYYGGSSKRSISEEQLSNLGYRLLVFSLIPCCLERGATTMGEEEKDSPTDSELGHSNQTWRR